MDLSVPVKNLRTAEQQIIQLTKALLNEPKVLILDELTAVLQEKDIQNIFRIIGILKERGIGVIYISHRLDEVFSCCDSYTVLCDGRHVGSGRVCDIDKAQLIKMIIGRELTNVYPPINENLGEVVLELQHLTAPKAFTDISLTVRAGEVVGLAGLLGAGKTELVNAIFGNHKIVSGKVLLHGQEVHIHSPRQAIRMGMGIVPDERRRLGLNMLFDIKDNTTLPNLDQFRRLGIFQDLEAEARAAFDVNEKMNLKYYSLWQTVKKLSGGNQQKVVIAKWMATHPAILILDEPTRGIDVGAKKEIHALMSRMAQEGVAIIMISSELPEVLGMADRIYVMHEGRLKGQIKREDASQEIIMKMAIS